MDIQSYLKLQPWLFKLEPKRMHEMQSTYNFFTIFSRGVAFFHFGSQILTFLDDVSKISIDIYILADNNNTFPPGLFFELNSEYYFVNHLAIEEVSYPKDMNSSNMQMSVYIRWPNICVEVTMLPIYSVPTIFVKLNNMVKAMNMSLKSSLLCNNSIVRSANTSDDAVDMALTNWKTLINESEKHMQLIQGINKTSLSSALCLSSSNIIFDNITKRSKRKVDFEDEDVSRQSEIIVGQLETLISHSLLCPYAGNKTLCSLISMLDNVENEIQEQLKQQFKVEHEVGLFRQPHVRQEEGKYSQKASHDLDKSCNCNTSEHIKMDCTIEVNMNNVKLCTICRSTYILSILLVVGTVCISY